MVRLFKHYVPHTVLWLGLADFLLLLAAGEAGWLLRLWQIAGGADPDVARLPHLLTFALTLQLAMVGVGVYGVDALRSLRIGAARLVVAVSLGIQPLDLRLHCSHLGLFLPAHLRWGDSPIAFGLGANEVCDLLDWGTVRDDPHANFDVAGLSDVSCRATRQLLG